MKTSKLLEDCIIFHKCTVFFVDIVDWQKSYMMGSLKKPHGMTIKKHVSRCETMNGYISLLPTLQDSSLAVASTEKGNISFNNATLASITRPQESLLRQRPRNSFVCTLASGAPET